MKKRVIAAVVLIPLLLLLALVAPEWIAAVTMGLLLSIGVYEMLYRTGIIRHPRLLLYAMVMAFAVTMWSYLDAVHAYLQLLLLVYTVLLFAEKPCGVLGNPYRELGGTRYRRRHMGRFLMRCCLLKRMHWIRFTA